MKFNIFKILFSLSLVLLFSEMAQAQRYRVACAGNQGFMIDDPFSGQHTGLNCQNPHSQAGPCVAGNVGSAQGTAQCMIQDQNDMTGTDGPNHGTFQTENCECVDCETDVFQQAMITSGGPPWMEAYACEGYVAGGPPAPAPAPAPAPPPGGGFETQTVQCEDDSGAVVGDQYCDPATKPATTRPCAGGTDCLIAQNTPFGGSCQTDADVTVIDGAGNTSISDTIGPDTGSANWSCAAGVPTGPTGATCVAAGNTCQWAQGPVSNGMCGGNDVYGSIGISAPNGAPDTVAVGASSSCQGSQHDGRTGRSVYCDGTLFSRYNYTCDCATGPSLAGSCVWEMSRHEWRRVNIDPFSVTAWTGAPTEAFTGQDITSPPVAACTNGRNNDVAYNQYDLGAGPDITLPGGGTENRRHISQWTCRCY